MNSNILAVENIHLSFGSTQVLTGATLAIERGKIVCLLGPSGCGKTTLLRCVAGFESIHEGKVFINNRQVSDAKLCTPPEKRNIGVVFQDYALFPHLTVAKNIAFGIQKLPSSARRDRVQSLLQSIELGSLGDRYPNELSGGQQQRVALARALAPEPDLLLLDEPFSHLDPHLRDKMKQELKQLLHHFGVTALIVTHNQDEAFDLADEVAVIIGGTIAQIGTAQDIYHYPRTQQIAEFLGSCAFLKAHIEADGLLVTELGKLAAPEHSARGQENLKIMLRPDDIIFDQGSLTVAEVKRIDFRGTNLIYHLVLPSGAEVQLTSESYRPIRPIGSRAGIALAIKHKPVLYSS